MPPQPLHAILDTQRTAIMADVLDDRNVATRSIIDLLYGILLARFYEGTRQQDAYDVSRLHHYALKHCIDPSRDSSHHHPIRTLTVHQRIMHQVYQDEPGLNGLGHLAEVMMWLIRGEHTVMTPMEFYSSVPPLFITKTLNLKALQDAICTTSVLSELIIKIRYRSDNTPVYHPKPEVEGDRMRFMSEFSKAAVAMEKALQKTEDTTAWRSMAAQHFATLSFQMMLQTLARSSTIEGLSEALRPRADLLARLASCVVYKKLPNTIEL